MDTYGKELILDLHKCDATKFTRTAIETYFELVCVLIDMERCKLTWWDDIGVPKVDQQTEPHLKGTSAVQFILTSSIVIHTLDLMGNVYINIFSCKDFNHEKACQFSEKWFCGQAVTAITVPRQ